VSDFYHPYVVEQLTKLLGISEETEVAQPALVKRWNDKFLGEPLNNGKRPKFIF
jgi:hypothetical protein